MVNESYKRCHLCKKTMIGIMRISGDEAPRRVCWECENDTEETAA